MLTWAASSPGRYVRISMAALLSPVFCLSAAARCGIRQGLGKRVKPSVPARLFLRGRLWAWELLYDGWVRLDAGAAGEMVGNHLNGPVTIRRRRVIALPRRSSNGARFSAVGRDGGDSVDC